MGFFPPQGNLAPTIVIGEIDDATLVIASEGIGSNDNDTTFPTSAAVKAYADSVGGIANIVEDTTPQLGGNLDCNAFDIELDPSTVMAFDGATQAQKIVGDAGGLTSTVPAGDTHDTVVNATTQLSVTETEVLVAGKIDTPDIETVTVSARDGTLAQTIADSTGVTTFVSGAVLVAPVLGTPASGVATNLTGTSGITGLGAQSQTLDMSAQAIDNATNITLDHTVAHIISMERNEAVTDDTVIGQIDFKAHEDVGGSAVLGTYAQAIVTVEDESTGTEDASWKFNAYTAGSLDTWMNYNDASSAVIALLKNTTITGTLAVSGIIDAPDAELGTVSARDGTLAQTIADSTGVTTFVSGTVLVAPVLGTPASGALTNCTSVPVAQATGILPDANMPDLTGDVTTVEGAVATTIGAGKVVLSMVATAAKTEAIIIAASDETTLLTTGAAKVTFHMPYAFTLTDIMATLTTAATDATFVADVNDGGTTIMTTNKLDIETGETSTRTAGTAPGLTDTALAANAVITVDIDTIGSTNAGKGLKVYLIGYQS